MCRCVPERPSVPARDSFRVPCPLARQPVPPGKFYNLLLQDDTYILFCALFVRVVRDATREMYTITKVIPPTQQTVVMYVDSIIRQVHLAPIIKLPEDDEVKDDEVDWDGDTCVGIPMWEVR